ncbi:hypothetical protein GLYMA_11G022233v4 [Glycine max]|nr:hypothetical protein GLYMA_11G022233v4 [Glycine max]KAH1157178.1 hypothetical protein GYH30_029790 [Glycine max]
MFTSLSLSLLLFLSLRSGSMQDINTTKIDFWYSKKISRKFPQLFLIPKDLLPVK